MDKFSGAAFSSILTCPLAASLTADSVLNFKKSDEDNTETGGDDCQDDSEEEKRDMPRIYFLGLIFIMVLVSAVVISFNGEWSWSDQIFINQSIQIFYISQWTEPTSSWSPKCSMVVCYLCSPRAWCCVSMTPSSWWPRLSQVWPTLPCWSVSLSPSSSPLTCCCRNYLDSFSPTSTFVLV